MARFILKTLKPNQEHAGCEKRLARFKLQPKFDDEASHRVGQRRFYDLNVGSEKKRLEKLNDLHNNPVQRGWVKHPGQWPWPSWRFYHLQDAWVLAMDQLK